MGIGDRIREARNSKGLTQKQLGDLSATSEITIRQYEIGKREPRAEQLCLIAKALDISADYLLGLSPEPCSNIDDSEICIRTGLSVEALTKLRWLNGVEKGSRFYRGAFNPLIESRSICFLIDELRIISRKSAEIESEAKRIIEDVRNAVDNQDSHQIVNLMEQYEEMDFLDTKDLRLALYEMGEHCKDIAEEICGYTKVLELRDEAFSAWSSMAHNDKLVETALREEGLLVDDE